MVDGHFKCLGSVQHLKTKFGNGYTLTAKLKECDGSKSSSDETCEENKVFYDKYTTLILNELKKKISAKCELKNRNFNNVFQYELPCTNKDESDLVEINPEFNIGDIYRLIELNKLRFNIVDYSLSQNTLDNVFINFVRDQTKNKINRLEEHNEDECDIKKICSPKNHKFKFPIHDNDDQLLDLN